MYETVRRTMKLTAVVMILALGATAWAGTPASSVRNSPNLVERLERLGNFSILLTALETANLKDAVATGGPFTLFAPTDQAFADLLAQLNISAADLLANPELANILLYHVAPGKFRALDLLKSSTQPTLFEGRPVLVVAEGTSALVNRAPVSRANVPASNGLIHVIDKVLLPPTEPMAVQSILDVLLLDGRFSILLTALEVTGLDDAVASPGPFTLFAPTDEAFANLLAELNITAGDLLANPALSSILLYHVLGSRESAVRLLAARTATTLQGDDVTIRPRWRGLFVNDSRIINPNVNAPNGVIHTIDAVLLP